MKTFDFTEYFLDLPLRRIAFTIAGTDVVVAGFLFFVLRKWVIRSGNGNTTRLGRCLLISAVLTPYLDYLLTVEVKFDLARYHGAQDIIYTVVLVPLLLPIIMAWPAMTVAASALALAYALQSHQSPANSRRFTGSWVLLLSLASVAMSSLAETVWLAQ